MEYREKEALGLVAHCTMAGVVLLLIGAVCYPYLEQLPIWFGTTTNPFLGALSFFAICLGLFLAVWFSLMLWLLIYTFSGLKWFVSKISG